MAICPSSTTSGPAAPPAAPSAGSVSPTVPSSAKPRIRFNRDGGFITRRTPYGSTTLILPRMRRGPGPVGRRSTWPGLDFEAGVLAHLRRGWLSSQRHQTACCLRGTCGLGENVPDLYAVLGMPLNWA